MLYQKIQQKRKDMRFIIESKRAGNRQIMDVINGVMVPDFTAETDGVALILALLIDFLISSCRS